ncbi:hypothetical protein [Flavobacterium sp. GCM10027622]|uniref:hypothetical protein n=1 Tax=unclassified Flavobacterium TaxID=196869 RepID=UPI00361C9DA0
MDELDLFEQQVIKSLERVEDSYYKTTYHNIQTFRDAFAYRLGRINNNNFERYGERVFCYEFYHQLRVLIDEVRQDNPTFLEGTKLQAEVHKMQIIELNQKLGLNPLSGEFAPDLLMHSPGNANSHPFAIEVKCEHNISGEKIFKDLEKLNEFVTRYNYQRALFIAINVDNNLIQSRIDELQDRINQLEGKNNIKIISKENQQAQHHIWQL